MVINDIERFVFIHIPKNAGTSIARMLLKHFDNINLLPENNTQTIMALSIIAQIAMHTIGNRK